MSDDLDSLAASELSQAEDSRTLRTTVLIAIATGTASMSFDFWYPFMPFYLISVGAHTEAKALFWIALATTVQGIARIVTGPLWGSLSDRIGRKVMFVRALYLAVPTILIAAFIQAPWQIAFALGFQGLFSGFVPAAVALVSVSVPERRLGPSLSMVTGCQYLGTTMGPTIGAVLAAALGYRGAILIASILPGIAATGVLLYVPRDIVVRRSREVGAKAVAPFKPSKQLLLIIFFYFLVFSMSQLIRLATPVAIQQIHPEHVTSITGLAFTLGGLGSAVSVLLVAPRFFRTGRYRLALAFVCLAAGVLYVLLSIAKTAPMFIACYVGIVLLMAATIPAINTLIAANVSREHRGTGFGWAASAQALAFIVGPAGAALFGAVSLSLGFVVLGGVLLVMSCLSFAFLREPAVA